MHTLGPKDGRGQLFGEPGRGQGCVDGPSRCSLACPHSCIKTICDLEQTAGREEEGEGHRLGAAPTPRIQSRTLRSQRILNSHLASQVRWSEHILLKSL